MYGFAPLRACSRYTADLRSSQVGVVERTHGAEYLFSWNHQTRSAVRAILIRVIVIRQIYIPPIYTSQHIDTAQPRIERTKSGQKVQHLGLSAGLGSMLAFLAFTLRLCLAVDIGFGFLV